MDETATAENGRELNRTRARRNGKTMEQRRRAQRWALALGTAAAAVLLAAAAGYVAVSASLPDQPGEPAGVTGVTVGNVTGTSPTPAPSEAPTVAPTPAPAPTGAVIVLGPTPLPADDHGGNSGSGSGGSSGGSSGSGGHGSDG